MDVALFIKESELKDIIPISKNNTITSPLKQSILDAQVFFIKPILCDALYNELSSQIIAGTVSADNLILLDYIKPCLSYYTLYQFLPFTWAKVREQGVVNQTGETASTITRNDLDYLREQAKSSAINYEYNLVKYLKNNSTLYPLYKCDCDCDCTVEIKNRRFRYI